MIIAGFIWLTPKKDDAKTKSLLEISTRSLSNIKTIDKKYLTLFSGTISNKNDKDTIVHDDRSIAIGRIFHKQSYQPMTKSALECLSRNDVDLMTNQYWGKYIYLTFRDSSDCHVTILRDPTGQLPFFYYQLDDGNIIFSSQLQFIQSFLGTKIDLNWKYLNSYLLQGPSYSCETHLNNIKELPSGCKLTISSNNHKIAISWNPAELYQPSQKKTHLNDSLIKALKNSLKSWVNSYEDIYLNLNDNLDSSALLYSLKNILERNQRLTAVAYHSAKTSSKQYAEKICKELSIDLLHINTDSTLPFVKAKQIFNLKPNRPQPSLIYQSKYNSFYDLTNSTLSSILINGNGGNNAFMSPPSLHSIFDYFREEGLKGVRSKVSALNNHHRLSVFDILAYNLSNFVNYIPFVDNKKSSIISTTHPDWIDEDTESLMHPIYDNLLSRVLPGKYQHIDGICSSFPKSYLELVEHSNPSYFPFMYQPIMELAIAIPSYDLYNDKYDQYPCRKAISDYFKTDSIWHRSNNSITNLLLTGFKNNTDYIKELCLEGSFVKQGIVDKDKLEVDISNTLSGSSASLNTMINLISAEIFLATWV